MMPLQVPPTSPLNSSEALVDGLGIWLEMSLEWDGMEGNKLQVLILVQLCINDQGHIRPSCCTI